MANKAISELTEATAVNGQDLFVLEQGGLAKKMTAETFITAQNLIDALAEALDGHGGIQTVALTNISGRVRTYTMIFSDGSATTFQVYDGTSIERIAKTSSSGLVDTYTVFMTDGTTTFFTVTNGSKGDPGYPTDEQVTTAVNTWLDNNVTPGTGAVLDRTLTMSNAAAPADLVGDIKSKTESVYFDVYGQSKNLTLTDIVTGKYIDNGGVIRNSGAYRYGYISASYGDTVVIDTTAFSDTVIINVCDSSKAFIRNVANWGNPNKYYINVGSGESYICISLKTAEANLLSIYLNNDNIDVNFANMQNILITNAVLPIPTGHYVRYSNGEFVASAACRAYLFNENLPKYITALLTSDTDTLCAIAFYSIKYTDNDTISSNMSTNGYIKAESVRYYYGNIPNGAIYHALVPENCKTVIITTKTPSDSVVNPIISFDSFSVAVQTTNKQIASFNNAVLSGGWKYIYHLGIDGVTNRNNMPNIPSQSVFDIRNAVNLGYKCIEANIHKTSDGKYVVTHGVGGNLGHDFDTLNGEDAYGTSISGNTLQYLKDNFRYRSSNPAYRTEITTLEEFLHEAKLHNIIVEAQYVDEEEFEIVKGIMGDRFFMYGNCRSIYKGVITEYRSDATKAEILARCEKIGKPYIYCMENPLRFSDNDMQDIINTLHQNGYYISSAYLSTANVNKYSEMGFDFFAITNPDIGNSAIINGKQLIFNLDGTVSWIDAAVS